MGVPLSGPKNLKHAYSYMQHLQGLTTGQRKFLHEVALDLALSYIINEYYRSLCYCVLTVL